MTRHVLAVDGELVIPLEDFVCSDVHSSWGPNVLILRRDGAVAEISGLNEAEVKELVARAVRVVRAIATAAGVLRIYFDGGDSIESPSRRDFEAWEVRLRDGHGDQSQVVALPGGGTPAYWNF